MLLRLAYSPCPNDTYIYYGIQSNSVSLENYPVSVHHHDIETLNQHAHQSTYEVTKMSFHTFLKLENKYRLCEVGNALGYDCGPVLVSTHSDIQVGDLSELKIALPGQYTTANLLFSIYARNAKNKIFTTYDKVLSKLDSGEADCGVIIHESRFLYSKLGYHKVCDLGQWWESLTGAPIPLGAVGIRSDLPKSLDIHVASLIRESLNLAQEKPSLAWPYIKQMAQELDDEVITKHIKMFVNEFTNELGNRGHQAVTKLRAMAFDAGLI